MRSSHLDLHTSSPKWHPFQSWTPFLKLYAFKNDYHFSTSGIRRIVFFVFCFMWENYRSQPNCLMWNSVLVFCSKQIFCVVRRYLMDSPSVNAELDQNIIYKSIDSLETDIFLTLYLMWWKKCRYHKMKQNKISW